MNIILKFLLINILLILQCSSRFVSFDLQDYFPKFWNVNNKTNFHYKRFETTSN